MVYYNTHFYRNIALSKKKKCLKYTVNIFLLMIHTVLFHLIYVYLYLNECLISISVDFLLAKELFKAIKYKGHPICLKEFPV